MTAKVRPAERVPDRAIRDDRRRALARARLRTHRKRLNHGQACTSVIYTGSIVNLLVRSGWLRDSTACDREHVGRAISALLTDIAEHS
jgi:hypothetical protein